MKIGLITTLNHNIGDDFIRVGIKRVLESRSPGRQITYIEINKHKPDTIRSWWHPQSLSRARFYMPRGWRRRIERGAKRLSRIAAPSRFDGCDLIVQCGAPVLWPACSKNEWREEIWDRTIGRLCRRIPVLNLAAGSCYPMEAIPETITDPEDADYLRSIFGYCRLTTARDTLARKLFASLGKEAPLIPCSALLSPGGARRVASDAGPILISYMEAGGHYKWDQNIDAAAWETAVRELIARLRKRHQVMFLCHDAKEFAIAAGVDGEISRLWPKSPEEYFASVASCKAAVCNRMHASVALAGMGIPSIAVCTDTRLLMVERLGLPCHYVAETSADLLESEIENLLADAKTQEERLLALKENTMRQYLATLGSVI